MSDKLGFTFYMKDWWTSDTFFELTAIQRYYYLECLFIMYSNDGYMKTHKTQLENRLRTDIKNEDWECVIDKFELSDNMFTHASVNKRLKKAITNRENGKKGGRPPSKNKPTEPKKETQNNPPLEREREREIEREKESNYNDEEKQKIIYPFSSQNHFPKLSLEILKEKFEQPSEWLHAAAKKGQVQIQDLPIWVDKFFTHVTSTGKTEQTEQEIKSHFSNWLVLQDKSPKKQKENVTNVFQAALVKKHGTIETN